MKKTINNYAIVTIINTLNNPEGFWGSPEKRSKLKVYIPIRTAIKMNLQTLESYAKNYTETYQEIVDELEKDYLETGKAEKTDDKFVVIQGYVDEYNHEFSEKLSELLNQTFDIEFRTYTEEQLDRYAELNGELMNEMEMDVLSIFVEEPREAEINE